MAITESDLRHTHLYELAGGNEPPMLIGGVIDETVFTEDASKHGHTELVLTKISDRERMEAATSHHDSEPKVRRGGTPESLGYLSLRGTAKLPDTND